MAPLSEGQVGLYVQQRLGLPDTSRLRLQSLIPSALNNLSLRIANDYQKRKWLMTAPQTVTSTITSANGQYYSDLTSVISTYGVMKDYLMYGTIFWNNTFSFTTTDITTATGTIGHTAHNMNTGEPIRFTTSGTLPSPLTAGTTYWVIAYSADAIQVATTQANAFAGTNYELLDEGSGTSTVTVYGFVNTVQWIDSPAFGLIQSALPLNYAYGWLDADRLYLANATAGTLAYCVPFVPTLNTLPDFLQNDVLDEVVNLAIAGGQELPKSAAER